MYLSQSNKNCTREQSICSYSEEQQKLDYPCILDAKQYDQTNNSENIDKKGAALSGRKIKQKTHPLITKP